jgi:hypothetical protein
MNLLIWYGMVVLEAPLLLGVPLTGDHAILEAPEVLGDRFPEVLFVLGAKFPGA